ncbi:hypothetical protein MMC19_007697 [Ptychographa xylographoides]|nr:hypothetical protein [Ptychographa xylographoides]
MQFSKITILSFLSVVAVSAYPGPALEERDLYVREAFADAYADVYGGAYQHALGRRSAEALDLKADAKEVLHEAKTHEDAIETGICTVGAFVPVVDGPIDMACLGMAGAQAAKAAINHFHHAKRDGTMDIYARTAFIQGLKDYGLI